jgi:hypothetical protein
LQVWRRVFHLLVILRPLFPILGLHGSKQLRLFG